MSREKKAPKLKGLTKTQAIAELATKSDLTKVQVGKVMDALFDLAVKETKRAGNFTIPGLVKLQAKNKAATPARPGRNPKTGEALTISAKPAKIVIRGRILAPLKAAWA